MGFRFALAQVFFAVVYMIHIAFVFPENDNMKMSLTLWIEPLGFQTPGSEFGALTSKNNIFQINSMYKTLVSVQHDL